MLHAAKDLYAISLSLFSDELSKIMRLNTSQLNRLVWLTFLLFCFRFQPRYFGFAFCFSDRRHAGDNDTLYLSAWFIAAPLGWTVKR